LAAKCAPQEKILDSIRRAGITAAELYLSQEILVDLQRIIRLCRKFDLRWALHAPREGYQPAKLKELSQALGAEAIVFHDIYWDDEWKDVVKIFKGNAHKLCIENTSGVDQPVRFMRRYGFGRCLDLEHMQMQCGGVFEEEFLSVMRQASHVHLTGYTGGSKLWHSHIHHSPRHNRYLLDLLARAGYSGMVVSEARTSLQTYPEFKKLKEFFQRWKGNGGVLCR